MQRRLGSPAAGCESLMLFDGDATFADRVEVVRSDGEAAAVDLARARNHVADIVLPLRVRGPPRHRPTRVALHLIVGWEPGDVLLPVRAEGEAIRRILRVE